MVALRLLDDAVIISDSFNKGELYRLFSPFAFALDLFADPQCFAGEWMVCRALERVFAANYAAAAVGCSRPMWAFEFMFRLFVNILQAALRFNDIAFTDGYLVRPDLPDLNLLKSTVFKTELIAQSMSGICKLMGAIYAGVFPKVTDRCWRSFLQVFQSFYRTSTEKQRTSEIYKHSGRLSLYTTDLCENFYAVDVLCGVIEQLEKWWKEYEVAIGEESKNTEDLRCEIKYAIDFIMYWSAMLANAMVDKEVKEDGNRRKDRFEAVLTRLQSPDTSQTHQICRGYQHKVNENSRILSWNKYDSWHGCFRARFAPNAN